MVAFYNVDCDYTSNLAILPDELTLTEYYTNYIT